MRGFDWSMCLSIALAIALVSMGLDVVLALLVGLLLWWSWRRVASK